MKKKYRIAVEGATTDGRHIDRAMIEQMAAHYDPNYYCATINIEHLKSYSSSSEFKRYGTVNALSCEEIKEGKLQGKLALYAELNPTKELIELNKQKQKLFSSVEISPKFADSNEAYLVGLAVTDDPASLGTELLQFSANTAKNPLTSRKQNPENLFSSADESIELHLEQAQADSDDNSRFCALKEKILSFMNKNADKQDKNFNAFTQEMAETMESLLELNKSLLSSTEQKLNEQATKIEALSNELSAFKIALDAIPNTPNRPVAPGGDALLKTDC